MSKGNEARKREIEITFVGSLSSGVVLDEGNPVTIDVENREIIRIKFLYYYIEGKTIN
jgi:hypothetical protein